MPRPLLPLLIRAALAGGTLDLIYAFSISWLRAARTPVFVLQSVASGALGTAAFDGGAATAALGAIAHYAILVFAAWLLWLASRHVRFAHEHPVVGGLALGAGLFGAMNFVVLPLSAYPFPLHPTPEWIVRTLVVHLAIGLTIAAVLRSAANRA